MIPKRVNLHQMICLIDGIVERKYDGTVWNTSKQDRLGASLKKWGATKSGRNISPQALRTLVAYGQYLGFLYIDSAGKNSTIHVTKAGYRLWNTCRGSLVKVKNLSEGREHLIMESDLVLRQMEKLQLTNPVNAKDCENISLFPFRFLLRILLDVEYIDQEEIAYFLFRAQEESQTADIVEKIQAFRKLSEGDRAGMITTFLATHIGNITLGQASSAGYFMSLCVSTGIVERSRMKPDNRKEAISVLRIRGEALSYVKDMLFVKYAGARPFDFGDDLKLWIDYFGDPDRDFPPVETTIRNESSGERLVQVLLEGESRTADVVAAGEELKASMFLNEDYEVRVTDLIGGKTTDQFTVRADAYHHVFSFSGGFSVPEKTMDQLADEILAHCRATMFAPEILSYLTVLQKTVGIDYTTSKAKRGAYLEYGMYQMLRRLKEEGVVDEVIWNGHRGKYGVPSAAPGGKTGTPDLVFVVGKLYVVLELTTIAAKSSQFSGEGSSVPDHIRLFREDADYMAAASSGAHISGVFCAPCIHPRNTAVMQAAMAPYGIPLHCITVQELTELFLKRDRFLLIKSLE